MIEQCSMNINGSLWNFHSLAHDDIKLLWVNGIQILTIGKKLYTYKEK